MWTRPGPQVNRSIRHSPAALQRHARREPTLYSIYGKRPSSASRPRSSDRSVWRPLPGTAQQRATLEDGGAERIDSVADGDTVILDDGRQVRLVGTQAPKLPLGRPCFVKWPLAEVEINGIEAATGRTRMRSQSGNLDARLFAIRHDPNTIYRFIFRTPPAQTRRLDAKMQQTAKSFRKLTAADRSRSDERKIKTRLVRRGDTVASLSRRMPMPGFKEEWFRVLNGMSPGAEPTPGQVVKVVVE
jgi:hypothetical protein